MQLPPCFSLAVLFSNAYTAPRMPTVLHNGKIVTVDKKFTIQQAVALQGDRILKVARMTTS